MATFSVQYIYNLIDNFSPHAARMAAAATTIQGSAAAAGAAVVGLGRAIAGVGLIVGAGTAFMVASSVQAAAKFEAEMANVRRVADLTREQMMDYGKDALKISVATGNPAEDIAKVMAQGAAMGLRDQSILAAFSDLTAKVAVAWDDINKDQASRSLATITAQWFGGENPDVARKKLMDLGDAMNELSNRSAFKAPELLKAFERGGVMAKQFGLSAEQFSAYAGTALVVGEKSGELQGTRARMTFDKLMRNVARPTKASAWAMKQLGYTREKLGGMILNNPQDALLDIMERTQGMDPIKSSAVVGGLLDARSAAQFRSVAGNLNEYKRQLAIVDDKYAARFSKDEKFMSWLRGSNYADMAPILEQHGRVISRIGSVEREFAKKSDTLDFAVKQRAAAFRRFSILLGEPFLQPLTQLNTYISGIATSMGDWVQANGDVAKSLTFGGLAAGLAGLGYFALSAIGYMTGIGGALATLKALGLVTLKLSILAIGVATAYWLYDNWAKLKEMLADPIKVDILFPELPDWLRRFMGGTAAATHHPDGMLVGLAQQTRFVEQMHLIDELRNAGTVGGENVTMPAIQSLATVSAAAQAAKAHADAVARTMAPHQMLAMPQAPETTWSQRTFGGVSPDWGAQPFNAGSNLAIPTPTPNFGAVATIPTPTPNFGAVATMPTPPTEAIVAGLAAMVAQAGALARSSGAAMPTAGGANDAFNAASIPQGVAVDVRSTIDPVTFSPATINVQVTGSVNGPLSGSGTGSVQANPARGTSAAEAGAPAGAR